METKDRAMVKPSASKNVQLKSDMKATQSDSGANESKGEAKPEQNTPTPVLPIARAADRLSKFEQFQKLGERFEFLRDKDPLGNS